MRGADLKHQKDERRGSSRRSLVFSQGFKEDGGSGPTLGWDLLFQSSNDPFYSSVPEV